MDRIKIGDIVMRKSYKKDVIFKVCEIIRSDNREDILILKGLNYRLIADAPVSDVEKVKQKDVQRHWKQSQKRIQMLEKGIMQSVDKNNNTNRIFINSLLKKKKRRIF